MTAEELPDLGCACANLRRAARLVTQLYAREMGGIVEPTQFALLSALRKKAGSSQASLGSVLGLDKTSLSRNLRLLHSNGWIEAADEAQDRRERGYRLTDRGREVLAAAFPGWKRAQAKLRSALGTGGWERLQAAAIDAARAAG